MTDFFVERTSKPGPRRGAASPLASGACLRRVLLFAYGSNMCPGKLALATEGAVFVDIGLLVGHDIRFHKKSDDGSGKADAFATGDPAHVVWGALFDVPESSWASLVDSDRGYDEKTVEVATPAAAKISCRTFLARPQRIEAGLKPYLWYKRYVVEGARSHGLPPEYVERLEAAESLSDPDRKRAAAHESVAC